jgi:predicted nucleotidyltransferase
VVTSEDLVVLVFDALSALHVPFMVSGSLASNFYGVPRATQDADLVLMLNAVPVDALAARIGQAFELDTQLAFETVTGSRRLVARARGSAFTVELFDVTDDDHDRERFSRRRSVDVLGRTVAVPTAEDVIITKLRWWQRAGRRKDLEDARNVVAVQRASLDQEYLRRWCRTVGVLDILEDIERSLEPERPI